MAESGPFVTCVEAFLEAFDAALALRAEAADDRVAQRFATVADHAPAIAVTRSDGGLAVTVQDADLPTFEHDAGDRPRFDRLMAALERHGIDRIVFRRGLGTDEFRALTALLASGAEEAPTYAGRVRTLAAALGHVQIRFGPSGLTGAAGPSIELEPRVSEMLSMCAAAMRAGERIQQRMVRGLAVTIMAAAREGTLGLRVRSLEGGPLDLAAHTTNVALMTAAMALEAQMHEPAVIEVTAAALVHDVGHLLLPPLIQGVPEPLLDERAKKFARHHPLLGARALLEAGCPPLWVSTALDHHRGIDGRGYPSIDESALHEGTRIVSLANYIERKRVTAGEQTPTPEEAVRSAIALSGRYFDPTWLGVFLRAVGVFPPGTFVELTGGQLAVVTRPNALEPLRPEVRVLCGARAGKRVDLTSFDRTARAYELSIVRAVPPLMLQKLASGSSE
jgi:HD-GYP domain-containing protein (c-di-GMP phosphodiesterase class II)